MSVDQVAGPNDAVNKKKREDGIGAKIGRWFTGAPDPNDEAAKKKERESQMGQLSQRQAALKELSQ
jgi:hypothetical protein